MTLILTSRQRSWVTGTVDLLVITPLLTVFGITAVVVLFVAFTPESELVLLGQRLRLSAPLCAFSAGICKKSCTSWSQSKMRKTLRLLRTTVKQEESRVDLQESRKHIFLCDQLLNLHLDYKFPISIITAFLPVMQFQLQRSPISARF